MTYLQAYTEVRRYVVTYVVEDNRHALHFFMSPVAANRAFPGAFDEPDTETED
jgi:hypothetical protein